MAGVVRGRHPAFDPAPLTRSDYAGTAIVGRVGQPEARVNETARESTSAWASVT